MAKVDLLTTQKDGTFLFYNLDASVGKGGTNRRDDVLLVQYLLKTSSDIPGKFSAQVSGGPPQVVGKWTTYDDDLLGMVQRTWKELGTATWQDRLIDPVSGRQGTTPVHKAQYKIVTLNVVYQSVRPADFPKMAETADCPRELAAAIRAPKWWGS